MITRRSASPRRPNGLPILALLTLSLAACGGTSEPDPVAETVEVTPTEATRQIGETIQLSAVVKDIDGEVLSGKQVSWTSSAAAIATVNGTGLVTGVSDGTAMIRASVDGKTGTSEITVIGPCSTDLSPDITVGQTVDGSLATTDCRLSDGSYADGYAITVTTATPVQIDLTSGVFDTWLVLFELQTNGGLLDVAVNDDVDSTTTNSRIAFTLVAGKEYFILANSFDTGVTGQYQLSVAAAAAAIAGRVGGVMKPGKPRASELIRAFRPR